jgi:gas vesicle protein
MYEKINTTQIKSVMYFFKNKNEIQNAYGHLIDVGFTKPNISIIKPDKKNKKILKITTKTKISEGFSVGFILGAFVGSALSLLALGYYGGYNLFNASLASYPTLTVITGIALGGLFGGLVGLLVAYFMPKYISNRSNRLCNEKGALVVIECSTAESLKSAKRIAVVSGGVEVSYTP